MRGIEKLTMLVKREIHRATDSPFGKVNINQLINEMALSEGHTHMYDDDRDEIDGGLPAAIGQREYERLYKKVLAVCYQQSSSTFPVVKHKTNGLYWFYLNKEQWLANLNK